MGTGDEASCSGDIGALPPRTPRVPDSVRPALPSGKPRAVRLLASGAIVVGTLIGGTMLWHFARPTAAAAPTIAAHAATDDEAAVAIDAVLDRALGAPTPLATRAPPAPPASVVAASPTPARPRPRPPAAPTHDEPFVPPTPRAPVAPATVVIPPVASAPIVIPPTRPLETRGLIERCIIAGDNRCIVDQLGHGRAHSTLQLRLLLQAQRALSLRQDACATAMQLLAAPELDDAERARYASYRAAQCGAPVVEDAPY